ncbi:MAG: hypothetical protein JO023_12675, partial [Chloroflexi bacterium]|nr:hypothetical protein [Chloroflexota bacterium]
MSDDELAVTYRHDNKTDVDIARYDGQDIATVAATDSGALVTYGGAGQE